MSGHGRHRGSLKMPDNPPHLQAGDVLCENWLTDGRRDDVQPFLTQLLTRHKTAQRSREAPVKAFPVLSNQVVAKLGSDCCKPQKKTQKKTKEVTASLVTASNSFIITRHFHIKRRTKTSTHWLPSVGKLFLLDF